MLPARLSAGLEGLLAWPGQGAITTSLLSLGPAGSCLHVALTLQRAGVAWGWACARGGSREVPAGVHPYSFRCVPLFKQATSHPGSGVERCAEWGALVRLSQQLLPAVRTTVSVKKVSRGSGVGVLAADTPLGLLGKGCREGVPACPLPPRVQDAESRLASTRTPSLPPITTPCAPAGTTPSPSRLGPERHAVARWLLRAGGCCGHGCLAGGPWPVASLGSSEVVSWAWSQALLLKAGQGSKAASACGPVWPSVAQGQAGHRRAGQGMCFLLGWGLCFLRCGSVLWP